MIPCSQAARGEGIYPAICLQSDERGLSRPLTKPRNDRVSDEYKAVHCTSRETTENLL